MTDDDTDTDCLNLPISKADPVYRPNGALARKTIETAKKYPRKAPGLLYPENLPAVPRTEQIGNGAGMIKVEEAVKVISRRYTNMAFARLAWIAENSNNHGAAVNALKEILERAWGKAHVMAEAETKPGTNIQVVFGDRPKLTVVDGHTATEIEDDSDNDE